jgi:hypothetical protein
MGDGVDSFFTSMQNGAFFSTTAAEGGQHYDESSYNWSKGDWDKKLEGCANMMHEAPSDDAISSSRVYTTWWNMSVMGDYNPNEFAWYASRTSQQHRDGHVMNSTTLGYGTKEKWSRVGVVIFDFYETGWSSLLRLSSDRIAVAAS